jgi:ribosomal protein S18 acetylase RimI-like enzyme
MMTVFIRPRQPEDLRALADVLVRVHAVDGYPVEGVEQPEQWLAPPRQLMAWTALISDKAVGHIALVQASSEDDAGAVWQQHTPGGHLDTVAIPLRLFVDPEHRRLGVAKQLMTVVREYALAHDLALVFDVMLKDRAAIRLYEALGCRRLGTIDHHHSDGLVEPAAVYVVPRATKVTR